MGTLLFDNVTLLANVLTPDHVVFDTIAVGTIFVELELLEELEAFTNDTVVMVPLVIDNFDSLVVNIVLTNGVIEPVTFRVELYKSILDFVTFRVEVANFVKVTVLLVVIVVVLSEIKNFLVKK